MVVVLTGGRFKKWRDLSIGQCMSSFGNLQESVSGNDNICMLKGWSCSGVVVEVLNWWLFKNGVILSIGHCMSIFGNLQESVSDNDNIVVCSVLEVLKWWLC